MPVSVHALRELCLAGSIQISKMPTLVTIVYDS